MVCEASTPGSLESACVCVLPTGRAIDPLQRPLSSLGWGGRRGDSWCPYDQYYRIPGSAHPVLNSPVTLQPFCRYCSGYLLRYLMEGGTRRHWNERAVELGMSKGPAPQLSYPKDRAARETLLVLGDTSFNHNDGKLSWAWFVK